MQVYRLPIMIFLSKGVVIDDHVSFIELLLQGAFWEGELHHLRGRFFHPQSAKTVRNGNKERYFRYSAKGGKHKQTTQRAVGTTKIKFD